MEIKLNIFEKSLPDKFDAYIESLKVEYDVPHREENIIKCCKHAIKMGAPLIGHQVHSDFTVLNVNYHAKLDSLICEITVISNSLIKEMVHNRRYTIFMFKLQDQSSSLLNLK